MFPIEVLQFCQEHFDKCAVVQGQWVRFSCPFAKGKHKGGTDNDPSFGVNVDYPHGYNCFTCNSKGKTLQRLYNIFYHNGDVDYFTNVVNFTLPLYEDTHVVTDVQTFYFEDDLAQLQPAFDNPHSCAYLILRNINFELAKQFGICYDFKRDRLCFPIYNAHKRCIGIQGRSLNGTLPKYKLYPHSTFGKCNANILYGENYINWDMPLVVVEGMFDVVAVSRFYPNVTSFFGVNPTDAIIRKLRFASKILMLFDCDEAGSLACETLYEHLPFGTMVDIRNCSLGYKDPGEMPIDTLRNLLKLHLANYIV